MLEDAETSRPPGQEPAKPASRERQREILGRQPLIDPKKTRMGINKALFEEQSEYNYKRPTRRRRDEDYYDDDY
jgi:hypothetical protein